MILSEQEIERLHDSLMLSLDRKVQSMRDVTIFDDARLPATHGLRWDDDEFDLELFVVDTAPLSDRMI